MFELSKTIRSAYEIDSNGFIVDVILVDVSEDIPKNVILNKIENYYHKPKWIGSGWIEGETQEEKEEREALERLNSLQPSPEDIADSELEIKILTLLIEMGVV